MPRREHPRKAEAMRRLRGGEAVARVARSLGVSRATLHRWRDTPAAPPDPIQEGPDWDLLLDSVVADLARGSAAGRATASAALAKIVRDQLAETRCKTHIDAEVVQDYAEAVCDVVRTGLRDGLRRDLLRTFGDDLDADLLAETIDEAGQRIFDQLQQLTPRR